MEPDYSTYSLRDLLEAREAIDKAAHPLRYFKICQEIEDRVKQPANVKAYHSKDFFAVIIFVKAMMLFSGFVFTHKLYIAYTEGHISWRGRSTYYAELHPEAFNLVVIIILAFLIFTLYIVFTNHWTRRNGRHLKR
ncbi:hypothetical protein [Salinimonas iocasae]|uniref:Uncharacterized protein n=1 Tax=Salinimonas iocasae TaxID=2572577 RepID=A0A5B7YGS9_9ALTE|nr:hypothetical protein [Salinimonas iocasae]QCZ94794.1 hypothetical protein FBQ74_15560 [Salinimonas iocasae]